MASPVDPFFFVLKKTKKRCEKRDGISKHDCRVPRTTGKFRYRLDEESEGLVFFFLSACCVSLPEYFDIYFFLPLDPLAPLFLDPLENPSLVGLVSPKLFSLFIRWGLLWRISRWECGGWVGSDGMDGWAWEDSGLALVCFSRVFI